MEVAQTVTNNEAIIKNMMEAFLKETLVKEVQRQLQDQLALQAAKQAPKPNPTILSSDRELLERMVRVEEELKHQRELLQQNQELLKSFMQQVDKRFEQVDKRFNFMQWLILGGITLTTTLISLLKLFPAGPPSS